MCRADGAVGITPYVFPRGDSQDDADCSWPPQQADRLLAQSYLSKAEKLAGSSGSAAITGSAVDGCAAGAASGGCSTAGAVDGYAAGAASAGCSTAGAVDGYAAGAASAGCSTAGVVDGYAAGTASAGCSTAGAVATNHCTPNLTSVSSHTPARSHQPQRLFRSLAIWCHTIPPGLPRVL